MAGFSKKTFDACEEKAVVLVTHCVDTEGPIGGDVRRNPDGTPEFLDDWHKIKSSLDEITNDVYRDNSADSFGNKFLLNWFIMDFTGFSTNPKKRIAAYHDTYDNIKSLNTQHDAFYWHYHQPPQSGVGDQWSDDWDNSQEHYNILGRRLLERNDFPEAFRAGGTIEDNKCSLWLEDNLMIDFSNRVSYRSYKTGNIFDFNWFGAPSEWGSYHPSKESLVKPGNMRRYVTRCVDLKSRLHMLEEWEVAQAFTQAQQNQKPVILSYFSHDHRDMRAETNYALDIIKRQSRLSGVPFAWCNAKEAIKITQNLPTIENFIGLEQVDSRKIMIYFRHDIYQRHPFVFTKNKNNVVQYHKLNLEHVANCPYYIKRCFLDVESDMIELGVACTSLSGDKAILVTKI